MSFQNFQLNANPFRLTPASNPDELIWAGFPELKAKLESRIKRSLKISNTSLILNWGEYGSGKTHASRYYCKPSILNEIATSSKSNAPFGRVIVLPKGKDPVYDFFTSVIDRIDFDLIRKQFADIKGELETFISAFSDNNHVNNILKTFFSDLDSAILKRYLYGNTSSGELKDLRKHGVLRNLGTDNDYILVLSGLFNCLTYKKIKYSCIILWIDEFEDISILSSVNIDKTNNLIRELLENTPNNLLLFVNLTQTSLVNLEDLGEYLYDAVRSRIKDRIEFPLPSASEIKRYISDLLANPLYREVPASDIYFPFQEDVIDKLIELLGHVSLRRYNESLSMLLELADIEEKASIDVKFLMDNQSEVIGWKE